MLNILKYPRTLSSGLNKYLKNNKTLLNRNYYIHDLEKLVNTLPNSIKYSYFNESFLKLNPYNNTFNSTIKYLPKSISSLLIINNKKLNTNSYDGYIYYPIVMYNHEDKYYNHLKIMDSINGNVLSYNYNYSPISKKLYINDLMFITENKTYSYNDLKDTLQTEINKNLHDDFIYIQNIDDLKDKYNYNRYKSIFINITLSVIVMPLLACLFGICNVYIIN